MQSSNSFETSPQAKIKASVDLCRSGLITKNEAINRVSADELENILSGSFDKQEKSKAISENRIITCGVGASSGAISGKAVFDTKKAKELILKGEKVILIKNDTNADDVDTIKQAGGVIAVNAGVSGHAVVIAKGAGKPCIVGCNDVAIDESAGWLKVGNKVVNNGDLISIDGKTGEIIEGKLKIIQDKPSHEVFELLNWADEISNIKVIANADTPADATYSIKMGAQGIGLCRTEHMFFNEQRLNSVKKVLLSKEGSQRRKEGLKELEKYQYEDFIEIFKALEGKPVTIRLLDMPLDEFVPESLKKESNPMMGNRGSRFGIVDPDIYKMQARAIAKAYTQVNCKPKIMLPMISTEEEFKYLSGVIKTTIEETLTETLGDKKAASSFLNDFKIGSMIEIPSSIINAGELAKEADFLSIGSNDLTQFTLGLSRNDSSQIIESYLKKGILKENPFKVLHSSVIKFIQQGINDARKIKPNIEVSICGEQGSNAKSIENSYNSGVNCVSVSPARVAVTRLLAAQRTQNSREPGKITFTGLNKKFNVENDKHQHQLEIFDDVTSRNFKKSFEEFSQQPLFKTDEIKAQLSEEYSNEVVDKIKLTGDKAGYNNIVLVMPGINPKTGEIPGIFPIITDKKDVSTMGGGHWRTEEYFLNCIVPQIKNQIPTFNFGDFKNALGITTDTQRTNPKNLKLLPAGVTSSNSHLTMASNSNTFRPMDGTFDRSGKASFVSLHGFVVYDNDDNKYMIIDDKPGVAAFIKKNSVLFEELNERYNVKIIVGNIDVNKQVSVQKEKNDFINQMIGQLKLSNLKVKEFKTNKNDLNTYELIEYSTNPNKQNKQY
ncbi:MAG: putative PEP-binding protein [bacterium]